MRATTLRRTVILPLLLAVSPFAITACQTPAATAGQQQEASSMIITGTATYRERMMAPKGSVLKVELNDISRADAPSVQITEWSTSLDDGGVPKPFTLEVNEALDSRFTYAIRATITGPQGELLWTTDTAHLVTPTTGTINAGELVMIKASAPAPDAALPLSGKEWTVLTIGGDKTVSKRPLTIRFEKDGRVSGFAGCNSFGGTFTESSGKVSFKPLVSTMMGCLDETLSQQEGALHATLRDDVKVTAGESGKLILTGTNGTGLTLEPTPAIALHGTSWLVEAMGGTAIVAGSEPQIKFDAQEGRISGTTGCNRFFGAYAQEQSNLQFSGVGMTKMACLNEGVSQQEHAFTTLLSGKATASLDPFGNLTVRAENGVSFTARPLPAEGEEVAGDPTVLIGEAWVVEDINRGGIIDNTVLNLSFIEGGQIVGSTGCNTLTGRYTATGSTLTISQSAISAAACLAPAVADQEKRFVDALLDEVSWRITADGALELTRKGGHRILLRR